MQDFDNSSFNQNVALARERNPDYKEVILSIDESRSFLSEPAHECPNSWNEADLRLYGTMHGRYSQEWGHEPGPFHPEPEEARHVDFFECNPCETRCFLQYEDRQLVVQLSTARVVAVRSVGT